MPVLCITYMNLHDQGQHQKAIFEGVSSLKNTHQTFSSYGKRFFIKRDLEKQPVNGNPVLFV